MKITPVKTPGLVQRMLPDVRWAFDRDKPVVYLTFDDGPMPEITPWVLDQLDQFNAKATFFCVGSQVMAHPDIYNSILEKEHAVGNHTHNHLRGWTSRDDDYLLDVETASALIKSKLFRPPYGQIRISQINKLKKLDYHIIMWSVLSKDWDLRISPEQCEQNVIDHVTAGDIVVFHDSLKASRNLRHALPGTLKFLSEKGFEFKRIPELTR